MSLTSRVQTDLAFRVEKGGPGILIFFLVVLFIGESSDEDRSSIPDNLKDLSWWNFGDIDLKISISVVPRPSIESSDEGDGI